MGCGSVNTSWDRCYDFLKIFSPKTLANKIGVFAQTRYSFYKNLTITLVFEKKPIFYAENWQKIAENCDHI
jgi:hypothetical protein